jgi:dienelactone hydrolase
MIIDSSDLQSARSWADKNASLGARTEYLTLHGVIEMLMRDPQFAVIPTEMIAVASNSLLRIQQNRPDVDGAKQGFDDSSTRLRNVMFLPGAEGEPRAALTERPVLIGTDGNLFGIVAEPRDGEKRRRAVILLNIGAEHHIGSSRLYVSLARRWARHGYAVLRLDLGGLGDSRTRAGRPENEVFPPDALDDIHSAIEFMQSRYGAVDITLGGLCSGAYHSLRAAIAGLPVNRILVINPMNFFWRAGITAEAIQQAVDVARNLAFYRERLLSAMIWKRIMTGDLKLWRLARILVQRPILAVKASMRECARYLQINIPNDLGRELEGVAARGVRVVFVFSRGEPGIDLLKLHAGSSVARLGDRCHVHIVESADHIFSWSAARALLEKLLSEELFARAPAPGNSERAAGSTPFRRAV